MCSEVGFTDPALSTSRNDDRGSTHGMETTYEMRTPVSPHVLLDCYNDWHCVFDMYRLLLSDDSKPRISK